MTLLEPAKAEEIGGAHVEPVVLAWVDPGHTSGRFMDSLLRLTYSENERAHLRGEAKPRMRGHLRVESGPRISSARNLLVKTFLTEAQFADVEWLLMLDSDMTFAPDLLDHLFEGVRDDEGLAQAIVGGLCFGGGHGSIFPTMYEIVDPKENDGQANRIISSWDEGAHVKVDVTGAACLMVHRGVYESMAQAQGSYDIPGCWYSEGAHNGLEIGEDWGFCLKARQMGLEIFVHTAAKIGHMKSIEMNELTWRYGMSGLKSVGEPEREARMKGLVVPPKGLVGPDGAPVSAPSRQVRRAAERDAERQRERQARAERIAARAGG